MPLNEAPFIPPSQQIAEATRRIRQRWTEAEYRYRYYCPTLDRPRADVLADLAVTVAEMPDLRPDWR
jgi:hypothetical protein